MSILKKVTFLFVLLLSLVTINASAEDLTKFDPVLAAVKAEADADCIDPASVMVNVIVLVDGSSFGNHEEQEVREFFAEYGFSARSVIFGEDIIVTAEGSLASAISLTDESAVRYLEGSRVMFPDPSVSVGN